jgi:hypothetical protein
LCKQPLEAGTLADKAAALEPAVVGEKSVVEGNLVPALEEATHRKAEEADCRAAGAVPDGRLEAQEQHRTLSGEE